MTPPCSVCVVSWFLRSLLRCPSQPLSCDWVSSTLGHLPTELANGWLHFTAGPFPECMYVGVWECVWVCLPGEGRIINSHHLLTSCHPSKPWAPLSPHCLRLCPPTETIIALQTSDMMEILNKTLFCLHILFSYLFNKSFVKRPLF